MVYYYLICDHELIGDLSFPSRRVAVPDARYDWLCEHWKPASQVPAYLHVVDIAGLVKGAHEGQVGGACTLLGVM